MDYELEILNEDNSMLLKAFTCIEDNEKLKELSFNKKDRRKVKRHSENIDDFLKNEALKEQSLGLNTTHLLINKEENELGGFVSLCNDCIPLELSEKEGYGFTYSSIPALKIARLAIASKYQGQNKSYKLFNYVIYLAIKAREISGLAFITLDCYKHRLSFYKDKFGFIMNEIQHDSNADDPPISMRLHMDEYLERVASIE